MISYMFDLDGTLVDTRNAVYESYLTVGIIPPKDFWGKVWLDWLPDQIDSSKDKMEEAKRLHSLKNQIYKFKIKRGEIKKLPLFDIYKRIIDTRKVEEVVGILTSASVFAVNEILDNLEIPRPTRIYTDCSLLQKKAILCSIQPPGIYFDDNQNNVEYLRKATNWSIIHVQQ